MSARRWEWLAGAWMGAAIMIPGLGWPVMLAVVMSVTCSVAADHAEHNAEIERRQR